jgi:trigger factor
VLLDEVNKMLSDNLSKYIVDEKLKILGEPLSNREMQKNIDWDKDDNFEFVFDIALAPEIEVTLGEDDKVDFYTIKVTDEMIDSQVNYIKTQMGTNEKAEEVTESCMVKGNFIELDESGEEKEEGIRPEDVMVAVDRIKDEDIKSLFIGKHTGDTILFDPVKAFENRHEVGHMLKISHEEADNLNSVFKYTLTEILEFKKAELNEELYKKIYGEETEVKSEEDLRKKIREELEVNLLNSSDRKFATDARNTIIEKVNPELPEAFLKRWLKENNKEINEDQIENEFEAFLKDLKWQIIKDFFVRENEIKIEDDEVLEFAKEVAYAQYSQYGIYNVPDDQIESFAKMILEKPDEKEKLYTKLVEDKVIEIIKNKITLLNKEVTQEEFNELLK